MRDLSRVKLGSPASLVRFNLSDPKSKRDKIDWRARLRGAMEESKQRMKEGQRMGKKRSLFDLSFVITIHSTGSWQAVNSVKMDSTRFAPRFGTRFPFRVVRRKWKRKPKEGL